MRKKNKGTTKYEKKTVTCDVGIAQCEDGTVKCKKKVKERSNLKKRTVTCDVETALMRIEPSNVRKR